jgi:hypothetical protein
MMDITVSVNLTRLVKNVSGKKFLRLSHSHDKHV